MTVTRRDVPPLVTVRAAPGTRPFGPSPYRNQELLLGSRVHRAPCHRARRRRTAAPPAAGSAPGRPLTRPTVTARCPAGTQVHLRAPHFSGTARLAGTGHPPGSASRTRATAPHGAARPRPRLRARCASSDPGPARPRPVRCRRRCLDTARLDAAAARG
ncbi:hypothetical protein LT493_07040 [Streptomyces tricolor]|nr:hypothetical protein [Streptomyces tricolor]